MKRKYVADTDCRRQAGFTFVELLVVVAVLAILSLMLAPALARTRNDTRAAQCLNNLRQMQMGWRVYASDNDDVMLPNAPLGVSQSQTWCGSGTEDWHNSSFNTNPAPYLGSLLAPYIQNQIGCYKCPGDVIPSDNGPRIRSYSMSGQMGNVYTYGLTSGYNAGYRVYIKVTDLIGPVTPSMGIVFCEESMTTLQDGYLQVNLIGQGWPDVPGSYHNGAMGVSFADGHVELHQWVTSALMIPVRYGYGYGMGSSYPTFSGGRNNADLIWWTAHIASPN